MEFIDKNRIINKSFLRFKSTKTTSFSIPLAIQCCAMHMHVLKYSVFMKRKGNMWVKVTLCKIPPI